MRIALDVVPETRGNAILRSEVQRLKMARFYNRRVNHRPFQPGQLVLRKLKAQGKAAAQGKLTLNWKGPYTVKEEIRPGSCKLINEKG